VKLGEGDHLALFLEHAGSVASSAMLETATELVALQKKGERIELAEFTGLLWGLSRERSVLVHFLSFY